MIYKIPVTWTMAGEVKVKADSLEEAIKRAYDAPLPENGEYVGNSFEVNTDYIRELYPERTLA